MHWQLGPPGGGWGGGDRRHWCGCDGPRSPIHREARIHHAALVAIYGYINAESLTGAQALDPGVVDVIPLTGAGYLAGVLRRGRVVFEGAQGVLLDEWRGFHPYTTWSTTTFGNAEALLAEAGETAVRLGVVRSYLTRHGPGPFVTEDPTLELPEPHNRHGQWQGVFRTGHFDAVALRYALEVTGGVDALAVTHLDTVTARPVRLCRRYQVDGRPVARLVPGPERDLAYAGRLTAMLLRARPEYTEPGQDWPGLIGQVLGAPVVLLSRGPTAADKDLPLTRGPAQTPGYLGGRAADRTGHRRDAVGRDAEARA
jgi:adenylosuccinate synthase